MGLVRERSQHWRFVSSSSSLGRSRFRDGVDESKSFVSSGSTLNCDSVLKAVEE